MPVDGMFQLILTRVSMQDNNGIMTLSNTFKHIADAFGYLQSKLGRKS